MERVTLTLLSPKTSHFLLALLGCGGMTLQSVSAGSAVAMEPRHGNLAAYGGPIQRDKQRALAEGCRRYGPDVRIIAASDVTGYGAIAIARFGGSNCWSCIGQNFQNGGRYRGDRGVSEGRGVNPQVKWSWRG